MPTQWRNWAGDQTCLPARIEHPSSRDELAECVVRASAEGLRVKAVGSGHSFSDIACTGGLMLGVDRLERILDIDPGRNLVRVEAGIELRELSERLYDHGLAIESLGDIDRQSAAGAIATGTHGTGQGFRNISSQVVAIELVGADGNTTELTVESDPEGMAAARVSLGALGVISAITFRTVPAFTIRRLDSPLPISETLERIEEFADGSDHFEFFAFPHTDLALLRQSTRTSEAPRPRNRIAEYAHEVVIENRVMDLIARYGRRRPAQIPRLARFVASQLTESEKVDRSYRVFASPRLIRFTEMEYALPREHAAAAVRQVLDLAESPGLAVSFPIEVRFLAADDAYLSTASGRDTAYVAVHMYRGMAWEPYFLGVEAIMDTYGGRPHWGKRHFQTAETLTALYPDWERFQRVRARLDPSRCFSNQYTDRVLGTD